jgi:phosphatidylglycerol:prolipoprotein diacylglycerol transferase
MAIAGGIVWKILPGMVEKIPGDGAGLPIRGYGVMLLLAMVAAVFIAVHRARQVGYPTEAIVTMTFFAFVFGIGGARLFYVVQFWNEQFDRGGDLWATLLSIANVTQGGLVVYGGFIGGGLGILGYLLWNNLPVYRTGDIVAPSLMIGLAIGRIGCLLNGCCYGGVCDKPWMALQFPAGSVPYMEQLHRGELVGLTLERTGDDESFQAAQVVSGGVADRAGVREGDRLAMASLGSRLNDAFVDPDVAKETTVLEFDTPDRGTVEVLASDLPRVSLPLYPTQIFATIDAALLCALLWFAYPFRRREGQIFGLLLILYPITRFIEESIRDDVGGYFGTSLTISQLVSLAMLVVALLYWVGLYASSPPIPEEERRAGAPAPA